MTNDATAPPTVLLDGIGFPEALRWWDEHLWFCDMSSRTLVRMTVEGHVVSTTQLDDEPSGLGFLPDGTPLVVQMWSQRIAELSSGRPRTYVDLADLPGERTNDLVVDREGRVYVGMISARNATLAGPNDHVVLVGGDRSAELVASGIATANGLAITPDGRELILAETSVGRLSCFPIAANGTLGPRATFAEVPGSAPDGICLDAGGSVWIGSIFDGRFLRVDRGGAISAEVATSPDWAISPMLGGAGRRTLFLGTTTTTLETMRTPGGTRGAILAVDADRPGAGWP
jgi:sugar lactone lactonase YvrE